MPTPITVAPAASLPRTGSVAGAQFCRAILGPGRRRGGGGCEILILRLRLKDLP